ncbi:MAG: hypothetical protein COA84_15845 [Robiginitomaculum sp.]|nr:MAG: hypothetical protein COA84_15845 [Robiginitomaculum sp.]
MRIDVDQFEGKEPLFFTAGNLPTQQAYGLTQADVEKAFVASLLRRNHLLFAASFYYESNSTRKLVGKYPSIWRSHDARAVLFINNEYPSYLDHGLGKIEKSPPTFSPYANYKRVQKHGLQLDGLGIIGVREDVDISALMVNAWISSCTSSEKGGIGHFFQQKTSPEFSKHAISKLVQLARERQFDFIWPSIQEDITSDQSISPFAGKLRRKLADLYAEVMADAVGAIETTPSVTMTSGGSVTRRAIGDLCIFTNILANVGLRVGEVQDDKMLAKLLELQELEVLRRLHDDLVVAALGVRREVQDGWLAVGMAEEKIARNALDHLQFRSAIQSAFHACGITGLDSMLEKILRLEKHYNGKFISTFRERVERIMKNEVESTSTTVQNTSLSEAREVLLFMSANPSANLRVDKEYRAIDDSLESLRDRNKIELAKPVFGTNIDDIQQKIIKYKPTYFHFSGHGGDDGKILFEGADAGQTVDIRAVAIALNILSRPKCAVFNSCFSESGIAGIGDKIEYSILMSESIGDDAAIRFSQGFYLALGGGLDITSAFNAGCNSIDLSGLDDSYVPKLFRNGILIEEYSTAT